MPIKITVKNERSSGSFRVIHRVDVPPAQEQSWYLIPGQSLELEIPDAGADEPSIGVIGIDARVALDNCGLPVSARKEGS